MNLMRRFISPAFVTIIFFIFASPAFANYSPLPDRASISMLPSIILLDLASDTFFILLSLLILGQIGKQRLGTVVKVCLLAMVAGFTADAVGLKILSIINGGQVYGIQIIQAFPLCIIFIACANYCFAKYYFKLSDGQSMTMGIIMGICTMPVGFILTEEFVGRSISHRLVNASYWEIRQAYSYAVIGTVFASLDIILIWLIKPASFLSRSKIALIWLALAGCASAFIFIPILRVFEEDRQISACSLNMRSLSDALRMYAEEYHNYPSSLSALQSQYKMDAGRFYCLLDKKHSGTTSYDYRKPPYYILHPEILEIVQCPQHPLPPGYRFCEDRRKNLDIKIRSHVIDSAKPLENLSVLVRNGICKDKEINCYYVPKNGQKARYILEKPTDATLQKIKESMVIKNGSGSQPIYKPGLSAELLEFYSSSHRIVRCPFHPDTDGNSGDCESRRESMLYQITEYKHQHGALPPNLEAVSNIIKRCPSLGPDGKVVNYNYHKPPDDFDAAESYWMLKCTHHPKYDVYGSAAGMPSMKALPKGESYN
ncbi:MAG: hypothetical protein ACYC0V_17430 [Armatimonadota bacterium]